MNKEYLGELCNARDCLCGFCEVQECEKCIVSNLINDAFNEFERDNEEDEE